MAIDLTAALTEFKQEIDELLERVTADLGLVEKQSHSVETLQSVYRDVHSLKGSAQLFGCKQLGQISHALETCLEPIRSGDMELTPDLLDRVFTAIDLIKRIAMSLDADGRETPFHQDVSRVLGSLVDATSSRSGNTNYLLREAAIVGRDTPLPEPTPVGAPVKSTANPPSLATAPSTGAETATTTNDSIRVQVGVLDDLMNLAGELVLIRNQVVQFTKGDGNKNELQNLAHRLSLVTTEIQNEVMKTRMQPIGNVLNKFQRVVRDLARELGKQVELTMTGTETELDKTLLEAIKDPLTHIVRNAVDHGIELPAERTHAGKKPLGGIHISAFHEGGQVIVEIRDNGRGLSRSKIAAKALSRGILTQDQVDRLPEREIYNLIFAPGFSTAEQVSSVSGRGVGMDVVRSNIEKVGGVVDLESEEGKGTTLRLRIPLTLAIVPALVVRCGLERFAIPQVKLVELVRINLAMQDGASRQGGAIEYIQGKPVYRLRGQLLPIVSLAAELGIQGQLISTDLSTFKDGKVDALNVVVLNADRGQFGLVVDEIEDSTDIVIKPLESFVKNIGVFAGATVMGDGSVALTLDISGLAARCNLWTRTAQERSLEAEEQTSTAKKHDLMEYLVVDLGTKDRWVIPLCLVNRLEEFPLKQIESAHGQKVVQYRDRVIHVIDSVDVLGKSRPGISRSMAAGKQDHDDTVRAIIVEKRGRLHAVAVHRICDVIGTFEAIQDTEQDDSLIIGHLTYDHHIYSVIDILALIDSHYGRAPVRNNAQSLKQHDQQKRRRDFRILYAEDNAFFRKHVAKILTEAGFRIDSAADGEQAIETLTRAEPDSFSLVLSDIEMPRMSGYELAKAIRADQRWKRLPLIALTTKFGQGDIELGNSAGFTRYLEKLNADQLIHELDRVFGIGA